MLRTLPLYSNTSSVLSCFTSTHSIRVTIEIRRRRSVFLCALCRAHARAPVRLFVSSAHALCRLCGCGDGGGLFAIVPIVSVHKILFVECARKTQTQQQQTQKQTQSIHKTYINHPPLSPRLRVHERTSATITRNAHTHIHELYI